MNLREDPAVKPPDPNFQSLSEEFIDNLASLGKVVESLHFADEPDYNKILTILDDCL